MAIGAMEGRSRALLSVMAMMAIIGAVVAQSPPTTSGCTSSLTSLTPCLSYITTNFTTSPPPQGCCSALSSVIKTSAVCLCQLFSATNPFGIPINQTRALALPGACNVTTPPLSQCKAVGAPAPSPSAVAGGSNNGVPPTTESVPSPAPSTSTPTPSAVSPSDLPPTSSVGGISPAGDGSHNPTSDATEAHFGTWKAVILVAGVIVVFIV